MVTVLIHGSHVSDDLLYINGQKQIGYNVENPNIHPCSIYTAIPFTTVAQHSLLLISGSGSIVPHTARWRSNTRSPAEWHKVLTPMWLGTTWIGRITRDTKQGFKKIHGKYLSSRPPLFLETFGKLVKGSDKPLIFQQSAFCFSKASADSNTRSSAVG